MSIWNWSHFRTSNPARVCRHARLRAAAFLSCVFASLRFTSHAFPPAPHHIIYGMVRDQLGNPITVTNAVVLFEVSTNTAIKAKVLPYWKPGANYQIQVPMDSGLTADLYKLSAQVPNTTFRIRVKIGTTTYLPIEMTGTLPALGKPAQKTRLDLTLGTDANHDGLPDAWEQAMIAALGLNIDLAHLNPNGVYGADGVTLYQHYIAGTYPFDSSTSLRIKMTDYNAGVPRLQFPTVRGRAYTLLGSQDLTRWSLVQFRIPAEGASAITRNFYEATNALTLNIELAQPLPSGSCFFKVQVQ